MALIRRMESKQLERDNNHSEATATYSIVTCPDGSRLLQIDTYGSASRQEKGKKSQSLRFSPEALDQLKKIIASEV